MGSPAMNKSGVGSMTSFVVSILVVMALFFAGYTYIDANYDQAGINDTLGFNSSYADLQESEANLNGSISDIKDSAQGISEADGNVLYIAWNGLTGLAATIGLFFDMIDISINVFNALVPALAFLPSWVKLLAEMAILITIILLIIGAYKGETKT